VSIKKMFGNIRNFKKFFINQKVLLKFRIIEILTFAVLN
jgi:hypothetical protein